MKQNDDQKYNKGQIRDWLVEQLAQLIFLDPEEIDPNETFESYGLSSREAVMLSGDLEEWLGRRLEPTLAWKYPTIEALAEYLAEGPEEVIVEQDFAASATVPPKDLTNMPIAIIGIGCRFPGANGPEQFWQLLRGGVDAVTEVPPDRWDIEKYYDPDPTKPGKMVTRWGGFLDGVDLFDNDFFRVSPREAVRMDPQQRLLLEVTWEALEDAGQPLDALSGSRTGVFIGISSMDYSQFQFAETTLIDAYAGTGSALSIAANRLSFFLDLHGPSIAVDTACSSSLVAVHQACRSLRDDECDLALVGGVNLILTPEISITFTKAGILSPDGRSRAFDAGANGYVRGEGAGIVVLKPLSKALDDHDRIYAVILGSAVNHDGRSNGLMAPNPKAQEALLRQAYSRAGISPGKVQYVEAHGTGTQLGDPIEAGALGAVLAEDRVAGDRCAIGSVKSNIGHLEAAAGIAGLIKVALSLKERQIPPSLHYHQPNPYIKFEELPIRVQDELTEWPAPSGVCLGGVSSFGFGGTNAHAVLTEAPPSQRVPENPDSSIKAHLLPLSARSPEVLIELARAYRDTLAKDTDGLQPALRDIAYSASVRRSHLEYRLAFVGRTTEELTASLDAYLTESNQQNLAEIQPRMDNQHHLVFVFSGQGSQWLGMGNELLQGEPTFRDALKQCDQTISAYVGWSVIDMMTRHELQDRLTDTEVLQPVLFSIQVALAMLWRSWGIEPDAVVGHSLGEVAAAHAAGILDLEDAARIVVERSRLMQRVSGQGAMLVAGLPELHARQTILGYEDRVSVAVINSPQSVVLSGNPEALQEIANKLSHQNTFNHFVRVDVAFHSPQMDSLHPELVEKLSGLQPRSGSLPFYSSVEGRLVDGTTLVASYWGRNLREPVRFSDAIADLSGEGSNVYLEISPHPVLLSSIKQCLHDLGFEGLTIPSLRRDVGERDEMLRSLGRLYTSGCSVDWQPLFTPRGNFVALPHYPWQRQHFWIDVKPRTPENLSVDESIESKYHSRSAEDYPDWLYEVQWHQKPLNPSQLSRKYEKENLLIFADQGGVGELLATLLESEGHTCVLVYSAQGYSQLDNQRFQIEAGSLGDIRRLFDVPIIQQTTWQRIIHMWSLDISDLEIVSVDSLIDAQIMGCGVVIQLLQEVYRSESKHLPRLWIITQGVHAISGEMQSIGLAQSPIWGLGRTIIQELPDFWGGQVDLDPEKPIQTSAALLKKEIVNDDGEDQIVYRRGERYVPRLTRWSYVANHKTNLKWRQDASYLITGGLGDLGLEVARWMVQRGAKHLILMGRTGLPPRGEWNHLDTSSRESKQIRVIRELESLGANVHITSVDVSNQEALSSFLDEYRQETGLPIRGIMHLAGIGEIELLQDLSLDGLIRVLKPKVIGTWLLQQLHGDKSLDFFVMFSSASTLVSPPFHGAYAAANTFLDAMAHYRRSQGQTALSVNWGFWSEIGMLHRNQVEAGRDLLPRGMQTFNPTQALTILGAVIEMDAVQVGVIPMDWEEWSRFYPATSRTRFLSELIVDEIDIPSQYTEISPGSSEYTEGLYSSTNADHRQDLLATVSQEYERLTSNLQPEHATMLIDHYLQEQIGRILLMDIGAIPKNRNLMELGLDSMMAMDLIRRIESDFALRLYPREVLERPDISSLSAYLREELDQQHLKTSPILARSPDVIITAKEFRSILQTQGIEQSGESGHLNKAAIFLLSAPRSGSTLLRVMLDGHPDLFCPPELHLLPFISMRQWQDELGLSYLDEGLQRAIMQLKNLDAEYSKQLLQDWISQDLSIQQVYAELQSLAEPRLLVDKSPSYAMNLAVLQRAERLFENPKYILIVRHPYAMIESAVRVRLDKILEAVDIDPYQFAEKLWLDMNTNMLELMRQIGPARCHLVRFEDLVRQPESTCRELCNFLGLEFDTAILNPYQGDRMTDGVRAISLSVGDPNFLQHDKIDPSLGEKWRNIRLPRELGNHTQLLAAEFQYTFPSEEKTSIHGKHKDVMSKLNPQAATIKPIDREKYRLKGSTWEKPNILDNTKGEMFQEDGE